MFEIPVIEVPTNLPNIRRDLPILAFAVGYNLLNFNLYKLHPVIVFSFGLSKMFCVIYFRLHEENGNMFVGKLSTCSDRAVLF